ncbi:MAG: hypothetical protein IPN63_06485 [Gammaproteobacteria bacterium]|nr:hypothetical protein [Gammaproteobacteria bacterium]
MATVIGTERSRSLQGGGIGSEQCGLGIENASQPSVPMPVTTTASRLRAKRGRARRALCSRLAAQASSP